MAPGPVVFVGGGGHASVCLDVFRSCGREVIGYLAPEPSELELAHLGGDDLLGSYAGTGVELFVAIGNNRVRTGVISAALELGVALATGIHDRAVVSPSAAVGVGTVIMPGAIVNARSALGRGVILNTAASIDHDGVVGDVAHIAPGCHLAGNVTIGEGAFLGVGVSVTPGTTIGEWATIGAGASVVRDIASHVTAVGVPARPRPTLQ